MPAAAVHSIPMAAHVDEDRLELYLLDLLEEPEVAAIEEHILLCPACQAAQEELHGYVQAMRAALTVAGAP